MRIPCSGIDPAFANMGLARLVLDRPSLTFEVVDLALIETEKRSGRGVKAGFDDLRRAQELHAGLQRHLAGSVLAFAEVPAGAKDAKAARGLGIAVGVIASSPATLVLVQPLEVKLATVGSKAASKADMIAWATALYPDAPWLRDRGRATGRLVNANQHLADAIGAAHAGIKTEQFARILEEWDARVVITHANDDSAMSALEAC